MTAIRLSPTMIWRLFPFLGWSRINGRTFPDDVVAGITVSLLAIPQSLAYAQLAGVPAYYGLYAAFIPTAVAVLFGSSAILSSGPVAMTSLLTAASVSHLTPPGSADFVPYVVLLAFLSGIFQILLGMARAGVLLNLLSHPVLMGFINAAALIIALSQLSSFTGIVVPQTDHFLVDVVHVLWRLDDVHGMSLSFGLLGMALMYLFKRYFPRLPGVLIMVVILTVLSYVLHFGEHGGMIVGDIPTGLPSLSMPAMSWKSVVLLMPPAFVIAIISFMEAMSSCKVIAIRTRTTWDENQELIGQGLAKLASAFCHSMPVSGSFSRSALNLASGAQSGFASLIAAGFVLLALLFLTPLMHHLPKPALAAMIVMAVFNLIDFSVLRQSWQAQRDDGIAAALTFIATLAFAPNIQNGILTGILFSLGAFIYRRMAPRIVQLRLHPDGGARNARGFTPAPLHGRVAALRMDASLFFANAALLEDEVLKLEAENPDLWYILIAAGGINQIDASGVEMLRRLVVRLQGVGISLAVSAAKRQVIDVMDRTGLHATIGADNFFGSDAQAIEALLERAEIRAMGSQPQAR